MLRPHARRMRRQQGRRRREIEKLTLDMRVFASSSMPPRFSFWTTFIKHFFSKISMMHQSISPPPRRNGWAGGKALCRNGFDGVLHRSLPEHVCALVACCFCGRMHPLEPPRRPRRRGDAVAPWRRSAAVPQCRRAAKASESLHYRMRQPYKLEHSYNPCTRGGAHGSCAHDHSA